jgi:hypothetical protein
MPMRIFNEHLLSGHPIQSAAGHKTKIHTRHSLSEIAIMWSSQVLNRQELRGVTLWGAQIRFRRSFRFSPDPLGS